MSTETLKPKWSYGLTENRSLSAEAVAKLYPKSFSQSNFSPVLGELSYCWKGITVDNYGYFEEDTDCLLMVLQSTCPRGEVSGPLDSSSISYTALNGEKLSEAFSAMESSASATEFRVRYWATLRIVGFDFHDYSKLSSLLHSSLSKPILHYDWSTGIEIRDSLCSLLALLSSTAMGESPGLEAASRIIDLSKRTNGTI